MDTQRKTGGRSAQGRDGPIGRVVTIGLPVPYEGVGNALRCSYRPSSDTLPDDMMALLSKLDRL